MSSLSASSRLAEAAAVATAYLRDADSAVSLLSQVRCLILSPSLSSNERTAQCLFDNNDFTVFLSLDVCDAYSMIFSLQAREWREALRTAGMFDRQDLVETTVAPQAADSASTLMAGPLGLCAFLLPQSIPNSQLHPNSKMQKIGVILTLTVF